MIAVLKREWKSYFRNITGWLFLASLLALYGLYFYVYNLRSGTPYISYALSAIAFVMLLIVPVLTMKSLAEERHSRTDQLILTAPVSLGKIVLGKYFAMVGVLSAAMAVIAVTPLILSAFGTVPMGESYAAVFGFWLYGCACIAIGMFLSSLTESQVIAAVISFAALFLGYMMNGITGVISESGNLLTAVLGAYDLYTPMESFLDGSLDLKSTVYFATLIFLCLFLSCQSIQKRRFSVSVKKWRAGVFSVGMIAASFAVAVGVNLLMKELPQEWTKLDVTGTKLYSLTDETRNVAKELEEDVTIYVLASEKSADTTLAQTLERYDGLSGHIHVEYKNPSLNPGFYQEYTENAPAANSLIVVSEKRSRVIDYSDIYEYSYDYTNYSSSIDGYDAEGQITSAITYVTMEDSSLPVIYEIAGHGETALSGSFLETVEKANMMLSSLTLLKEEKISDDAAAIIINGPSSDLSVDDAKKVTEYLSGGGKALVVCDFQHQELPNIAAVLSEYGIERVGGIVMENDASYYYGNIPYYLLPQVESTGYTASVSEKYVFAPYSEAFSYPEESEEIVYLPLLTTTGQAVSKADAENATTSALEEGDSAGPFTIALAAEKTVGENTSQLVLLGSIQLLTDEADQIVYGGNAALFGDLIGNIAGGDGGAQSAIPVKKYNLSNIVVTSAAAMLGGLAAIVLIPMALLALGIVIWAVRRKK